MPTFSNTPRPAYVYEAATDQWIPVGFGPHTHAVTDVTNAFNTTTVTTKGDLVVAAGSNNITRLAAGANGQSLVADSTTTTGLRWQNTFAAGRNSIINGDFSIWQRGTTFTVGNGTTYTADRYKTYRDGSGATVTVSRQSFTPGTAPVAGYESAFFLRFAQSVAGTGATYSALAQSIEDVRTFAGQTVTFSFWAKADANRNFNLSVQQEFGQGGSSAVYPGGGIAAVTTSWQRFSFTVNVPSIAGKTIGTGSYLQMYFDMPLNTTFTFDTWGWQAEIGNVATAFETASGTIGGELVLCQRYYFRLSSTGYNRFAIAQCISSTNAQSVFSLPTIMRIAPTALEQTGTASNYALTSSSGSPLTCSAVPSFDISNANFVSVLFTVSSGLTAGHATQAISNAVSAFLGVSAEL
jgi:hypothetical protein